MADKYAPFVLKKLTAWEEFKVLMHWLLSVGLIIGTIALVIAALV